MKRLLNIPLVVLSLFLFPKLLLAESQSTNCPTGPVKIALVSNGYGEAEMEGLIKGVHSSHPCKPIIEVIRINAFSSTTDYFYPNRFRNKLLAAARQIQLRTDLKAVLLNLDITAIYAAAREVQNGRLIYLNILQSAARVLQQSGHIQAVLIPAGNHGNYNERTQKWVPENIAYFFTSLSLPSRKFMVVAAATNRGALAGDTGHLNCRVFPQQMRSVCEKTLMVLGEAEQLPGLRNNHHPETSLAASVVMLNLARGNFDLNQIQQRRFFKFNP
ncbi:MAG: hypothetical protein EBQ92_00200 [Proteobacteria bacterium]|nr:hypothetical protein [Pseudomonadota bacterium]